MKSQCYIPGARSGPHSFSMILFWSPIYFHTLDNFSYPSRFPLMRILLQRWIYRSLWFFKFLIFFLNFFIHGCIMNSRCFCFFSIFSRSLSGFFVRRVFIKCYTPVDVDLLESWEVYSVTGMILRTPPRFICIKIGRISPI